MGIKEWFNEKMEERKENEEQRKQTEKEIKKIFDKEYVKARKKKAKVKAREIAEKGKLGYTLEPLGKAMNQALNGVQDLADKMPKPELESQRRVKQGRRELGW